MRRDVEYAMTHRVGIGGSAERCLRPKAVVEIAQRLQRWTLPATTESCQSCHSLPAVRLADRMALCSRCHAHRAERLGRAPVDTTGLQPRAERADPIEPVTKQLHGYAIRFNEKSVELFGFFEFIRPAAADRMEAEKPDLRMLWDHDSADVIGRTPAGTLRAEKRSRGVWIENDPPAWASRYVESVERRDVTGQSFAFITLEDDWWLEDGIPHREILDMIVMEFSAVTWPAYPTTTIRVVGKDERKRERQTAERLRLMR